MSDYIISEKALDDINNIWINTDENWSVEQARVLHERMDTENRLTE